MTKPRRSRRRVAASIEWTERAIADLRAIDGYIGADNPAAAERWIGRLIAKTEEAARLPMAGRVVPEKGRTDIREVFLRTYRVVYRVREDSILVLTVFEGHRLRPTQRRPTMSELRRAWPPPDAVHSTVAPTRRRPTAMSM